MLVTFVKQTGNLIRAWPPLGACQCLPQIAHRLLAGTDRHVIHREQP
jgi:hypothetical protein